MLLTRAAPLARAAGGLRRRPPALRRHPRHRRFAAGDEFGPREPTPSSLGLCATGLVAGGLGSLAGMGGGFVAIPMMVAQGLSQHAAHGTSLVGVLATGAAGAGAYALAGDVDVVTAAAVASTGALTATFGASAAAALSGQQLARLLGCFMLGVAPVVPYKAQILEAVGAARTPPPATKPTLAERLDQLRADPVGEAAPLLGIGCAAGFLAGLFGVGGGAVVVPLLSLATDADHKTALGTSLCAMVPTAVAGVLAHVRLGNVRPPVALPLGLGTCVGAFLGGRLAADLDEDHMKLGFGGVMVALGARTLLKAL